MTKPSLAMIGLGVMGANLARNMERNGFPVAVYNRSADKLEEFKHNFGKGNFIYASTLEELVKSMAAPRTMFIMVQAGAPVDAVIDSLIPLLDKGDIIIDGGNTFFPDTIRREKRCKDAGINFLGVGVSGGEEGALNGASIMPGGPKEAWKIVAPVLEKMAAQADGACTAYIGPDGAGHFVKMVHNGIEYGDMQLIAESYDVLRRGLSYTPEKLGEVFARWNKGVLDSFLIEITAEIFKKKDDATSEGYLVDKILDKAGQKGTGKWTSQVALDLGVAIPTISAAVDARCMSALKQERIAASKVMQGFVSDKLGLDAKSFEQDVHDALYSAKIMSYAQGMRLIAEASKEHKWDINLSTLAAIWKGGCIIRAKFLEQIRKAFAENPTLPNLMLDSAMKKALENGIPKLRNVVAAAAQLGIPVPALSASLNYFDAYRTEHLPQNLTQAQRDFFGAHTYERLDRPGTFHSQWS